MKAQSMNSFLVIAVATNDQHVHSDPATTPALLAFAMLHARRDVTPAWTFSMTFGSASTLAEEIVLMTTLADALPLPSVLIARSPETRIYAPLLRVAKTASEPVNFYLASRLGRAFSASVVDLDAEGPAKRRPTGSQNPDVLRHVVRCEVVDGWFEFLRRARGDNAEAAKAATNAWLANGGGR